MGTRHRNYASAVHRKLPPGSFLRRPVHSPSELVQQLRDDPIVIRRFERLMQTSPHNVREAFSNLRLTRTRADMVREI